MLTRLEPQLPEPTGDAVKDYRALRKALMEWFRRLNEPGVLTIDQATLDATNDLLTTPTGTFTPGLTFDTPGDLAVTLSEATGFYTKLGRAVIAQFAAISSAFTHTTASGNLRLTGLPFTVNAGIRGIGGNVVWGGITKANYTQIVPDATAGQTYIRFRASGSGQASSLVTAADMPTGGSVVLLGSVIYVV